MIPKIPHVEVVDTLREMQKLQFNTGAPAPVAKAMAEALKKNSDNAEPKGRKRCCAQECVVS